MKKWTEKEFGNHCYYDDVNGMIIGMTTKMGNHNSIYIATAIDGRENPLGSYVSLEYARAAIELYWEIQERTLIES